MATRTPGRYVPHWTDRPTVAADFLPVWNSFCGLAAWLGTTSPAEHVPAAVDTWIERHFWRESPSGKAVLVVGGTSGINLGIALAFARAGAHVAVVSRSPDKVAAAVEQLRALAAPGARMEGFSADVRDAPAIAAVLAQVHAALAPPPQAGDLLQASDAWLQLATIAQERRDTVQAREFAEHSSAILLSMLVQMTGHF